MVTKSVIIKILLLILFELSNTTLQLNTLLFFTFGEQESATDCLGEPCHYFCTGQSGGQQS